MAPTQYLYQKDGNGGILPIVLRKRTEANTTAWHIISYYGTNRSLTVTTNINIDITTTTIITKNCQQRGPVAKAQAIKL